MSHKNKMENIIQLIFKALKLGILIYLGYCAMLFIMQRKMMYPRSMIPVPPKPDQGMPGIETIWIKTGFGDVEAWYLPPKQGSPCPAPAVIFAHGNGDLIDYLAEYYKPFTNLGVGLFLVEYPGYGRSAGSPSQGSITETFVNAYDILAAKEEINSSKIVLFGQSLGGGAVCALAEKRPSAGLILMSPFISAKKMASGYFVPGFLLLDKFDNISLVKKYSSPILIIHGNHDEIIPYSHGVTLSKVAKSCEFITYNSGHNDCPPNWGVFWKDVEGFLKKAGIF